MGYLRHKKRALNYLSNHPEFNATIHALGGVSVGIVIMYAFKLQNPLMWVIVLGIISILGHLYAASNHS
jgi:hypothetical protein